MVRASLLPSINSWFQAATYQEFRRKIQSSVMTPLRVFEILFYCHLFYVIGDGAGIRISWTHCTGPWTIAPMDCGVCDRVFAVLVTGVFTFALLLSRTAKLMPSAGLAQRGRKHSPRSSLR